MRPRPGGAAEMTQAVPTPAAARAAELDAEVERHRGALPDGPVADDAPLTLPLPLDPTHYALLGLEEQADAAAVDAAVQRLALSGESTEAAQRLAAAVLSDPLRRPVYDAWLARERDWQRRATPATGMRGRLQTLWRHLRALLPILLTAAFGLGLLAWLLAGRSA